MLTSNLYTKDNDFGLDILDFCYCCISFLSFKIELCSGLHCKQCVLYMNTVYCTYLSLKCVNK